MKFTKKAILTLLPFVCARSGNESIPLPGLEISWTSKVCGDTQVYNDGEASLCYAVNVIRSLRWPGAVTVAKGNTNRSSSSKQQYR